MTTVPPTTPPTLELDDIQSGALHQRPSPSGGTHILLRIDDPAAGRALVRRLHPPRRTGRMADEPAHGAWLTVAFTHQGLRALGVPQASLDSFAPELPRHGRARHPARRHRRERPRPLGEAARHRGRPRRPRIPGEGRGAPRTGARTSAQRAGRHPRRRGDLAPGVLPAADWPAAFGFKDGIGQPAVEGSSRQPTNSHERPLQAGGSSSAIRTRPVSCRPCPCRTCSAERRLPSSSQVAHARGGLSPVPTPEGHEPRGRGAPRGQDGGPLAERGTPRPGAGARRSGTRPTRDGTTTSPTATTRAASSAPPAPTRDGESPRRATTSTAVSTLVCTG